MKRSALVLAALAAAALSLSLAAPALAAAHSHPATASVGKKHKKPRRGAQGPQGPAGPAGKDGAQGKEGKPGKDGAEGKHGPSGIVSVADLNLSISPAPNSTLAFLGETETVAFDAKTVVSITASLGFGSSDDKFIKSHFAICYAPIGGALEIVQPEFTITKNESVVQTVAGRRRQGARARTAKARQGRAPSSRRATSSFRTHRPTAARRWSSSARRPA